jgi:UDP:flavonoid glycosyltransferase YjiC (YdhE family)
MRVLFVSWPGYGHVLPMVPLLRAVQRRGDEVMLSSGSDLASVAADLGVPLHPSGVTAAEGYARLPDATTISRLPREEQTTFAARHLFGAGARDRARDLMSVMKTWRPDLVVHDVLELGSPVAASAYDVPHVTHGFGPRHTDNAALAAAAGTTLVDAGFADPASAVFAAPYLDICPPGLNAVTTDPWQDVRPLRPSPGEPRSDSPLSAELRGLPHADTVYVTLGTVTNHAPEVLRAVVEGCARLPVNLVATTGPGMDVSGLLPDAASVLIRPFIPQAEVLPYCRLVISHAGAGTMLGALCHGLPQLCVPQSTDQPLNAAALAPTGAALVLQPDEVSADAVADGVRRLLDEPGFADAAGRLRDEIAAMPSADDVLAELRADLGL